MTLLRATGCLSISSPHPGPPQRGWGFVRYELRAAYLLNTSYAPRSAPSRSPRACTTHPRGERACPPLRRDMAAHYMQQAACRLPCSSHTPEKSGYRPVFVTPVKITSGLARAGIQAGTVSGVRFLQSKEAGCAGDGNEDSSTRFEKRSQALAFTGAIAKLGLTTTGRR